MSAAGLKRSAGRLVKGQGRLVPRQLLSAREEAEQLVSAAAAEAARRRSELDALEAEARRRGHEEGFAAGREAGLASATELLAAARLEAEEIRRGGRDTALELARRMAEKIVGRTLELHPELLADIAAGALAASRARAGTVVLRVHPADLVVLERERPRLLARLAASVDLHLRPDETVTRHGCVVESRAGRLDARLEAQLDALERALGRTP